MEVLKDAPRSSDFILVSEFQPVKGPVYVRSFLTPNGGGSGFEKTRFVVRVMGVNFQRKKQVGVSNVLETPDMQASLSDSRQCTYSYVHHLDVLDFNSSSFSRRVSMCYVTSHPMKVMQNFSRLRRRFMKVSEEMKHAARIVFLKNLDESLKKLLEMESKPHNSDNNDETNFAIEELRIVRKRVLKVIKNKDPNFVSKVIDFSKHQKAQISDHPEVSPSKNTKRRFSWSVLPTNDPKSLTSLLGRSCVVKVKKMLTAIHSKFGGYVMDQILDQDNLFQSMTMPPASLLTIGNHTCVNMAVEKFGHGTQSGLQPPPKHSSLISLARSGQAGQSPFQPRSALQQLLQSQQSQEAQHHQEHQQQQHLQPLDPLPSTKSLSPSAAKPEVFIPGDNLPETAPNSPNLSIFPTHFSGPPSWNIKEHPLNQSTEPDTSVPREEANFPYFQIDPPPPNLPKMNTSVTVHAPKPRSSLFRSSSSRRKKKFQSEENQDRRKQKKLSNVVIPSSEQSKLATLIVRHFPNSTKLTRSKSCPTLARCSPRTKQNHLIIAAGTNPLTPPVSGHNTPVADREDGKSGGPLSTATLSIKIIRERNPSSSRRQSTDTTASDISYKTSRRGSTDSLDSDTLVIIEPPSPAFSVTSSESNLDRDGLPFYTLRNYDKIPKRYRPPIEVHPVPDPKSQDVLFDLLLRRLKMCAHPLLYSLLSGRPVVVYGEKKQYVTSVVKVLAMFVPGYLNYQNVCIWRTNPLRVQHLASTKLIGMSPQLADDIHPNLQQWISLLDLDKNMIFAPEYVTQKTQTLVGTLLGKRRRPRLNWTPAVFMRYVTRKLLDIATKALFFYHYCVVGTEVSDLSAPDTVESKQRGIFKIPETRRMAAEDCMKMLQAHGSDTHIIAYLAEVVTYQQFRDIHAPRKALVLPEGLVDIELYEQKDDAQNVRGAETSSQHWNVPKTNDRRDKRDSAVFNVPHVDDLELQALLDHARYTPPVLKVDNRVTAVYAEERKRKQPAHNILTTGLFEFGTAAGPPRGRRHTSNLTSNQPSNHVGSTI